MSSPPKPALSPPYPVNLTLPKKRPSGSASNSGSTKRRKPSSSSSSHPLRQTSFPPLENFPSSSRTPSFSPTVEDSISAVGARSIAGTSSIGGRGRSGRKRAIDAQSISFTNGTGPRAVIAAVDRFGSVAGINGAGARDDYEGEDEEGEGDGFEDAVMEEVKQDEAAQKLAAEHMEMLVNAFNGDQTERYNVWRRIKLKKETVRRITNQTLSQSVSQPVIMVINGYTKSFIGEIIERARDIQTEWLAAMPLLPIGESKTRNQLITPGSDAGLVKNVHIEEGTEQSGFEQTFSQSGDTNSENVYRPPDILGPEQFLVKERDRGPLTPDHLREALRRYKKDREGGNAGFQGLSLQGRETVAARAGGKRLFR